MSPHVSLVTSLQTLEGFSNMENMKIFKISDHEAPATLLEICASTAGAWALCSPTSASAQQTFPALVVEVIRMLTCSHKTLDILYLTYIQLHNHKLQLHYRKIDRIQKLIAHGHTAYTVQNIQNESGSAWKHKSKTDVPCPNSCNPRTQGPSHRTHTFPVAMPPQIQK